MALAGLLAGSVAHAAEITPLKLENGNAILVIGKIELDDARKFRAAAEGLTQATVFLESDGGSVFAAVEMGKLIRVRKFGTAVINDSSCNSACGLIWLAGTPRALSRSGRVGFHAAYSDEPGGPQESGVANAIVGRYLTLLKLPERAIIFATLAPPDELNWLTTRNFADAGIDIAVIDDVQLTPSAKPKAAATAARVWRTVGTWSVYVDRTLNDGCYLASRFTNDTVFRVGVGAGEDAKFYVILGNPAWRSLREGAKYHLTFAFDAETPWDAPVTVVELAGFEYLMANFSDTRFWREFAGSRRLVVTRSGKPVTSLSLEGAASAFQELVRCQKSQRRDD